jgi:hypothetical protein
MLTKNLFDCLCDQMMCYIRHMGRSFVIVYFVKSVCVKHDVSRNNDDDVMIVFTGRG